MTPLMLLHGFGGSPASFDEVLDLARARGLNAPILGERLWGHRGQLESPGHTFEREVDRLADLFRKRDGAGGILIGYSLGARLALGILTRHPDLASRAILIGANPGLASSVGRTERNSADDAWIILLETKGIEAFVDAWESQPIFASQRLKDPARWLRQRAIRLSHPPAALAAAMRVLGLARMPDTSELLPRLRTPILLVTGAEDPRFLALARSMQSALPRARLATIERSGHNPLFDQPEQMAALLAEELGEEPPTNP
jgi:2-succinyl-6-hydroxy-2,4-cyclohexadiene-1-carboxylate synthase